MSGNTIVKEVLDYIEENLQEDLSLDGIAKELNYSKFYLNRLFAAEVGCTMYKYIQTRRLTEAARQLAETKLPIVEIAQEAHYDSQQAFTQAFHRLYHCTPQMYRQRGVFYPKQLRLTMTDHAVMSGSVIVIGRSFSSGHFHMMKGGMAA